MVSKEKMLRLFRKVANWYYLFRLQRLPVWVEIERFKKHVTFGKTYPHYAKYYILYKTIRNLKPLYTLELGSGISSLIIGFALKENGGGVLVSMEESGEYGKEVMETIGHEYPIELHIEEAIEDKYTDFEGNRYQNIPRKPYDFIFIDGPRTKKVDLDVFYILEYCPNARVLIDNRKRTFDAFKSRFRSSFNTITNIGYINLPTIKSRYERTS